MSQVTTSTLVLPRIVYMGFPAWPAPIGRLTTAAVYRVPGWEVVIV